MLLLIDVFLVAAGSVFALYLRENFELTQARFDEVLPYLAVTLAIAPLLFVLAGLNRGMWRYSALGDYLRVVTVAGVIVVCAVAVHFALYGMQGVPRALPVVQALLMAFLLVGVRVAVRLQHGRRRRGDLRAPVRTDTAESALLIVGINVLTELFLRSAAQFAPAMVIAGIVGRSERHRGRSLQRYPVLGVPEEITDILKRLEVHGVFVNRIVVMVPSNELSASVRETLHEIETTSRISIEFFAESVGLDDGGRRKEACDLVSMDEAHPAGGPKSNACELRGLTRRPYFAIKRAVDFALATLLTLLGFPAILLVALIVALDVGSPILFWQRRPGMNGRPFRLYKFRTMRGAHDRIGNRISDDQRVSHVGAFLRRTRLDELPQLFNIICGDMAFVGPRPLLPIDQPKEFSERLLVRPGLTGWAQVAGGRDISARDKAILDVWYVRHASLMLDLNILLRTVPMLVVGERVNAAMLQRAWDELRGDGTQEARDRVARPLGVQRLH